MSVTIKLDDPFIKKGKEKRTVVHTTINPCPTVLVKDISPLTHIAMSLSITFESVKENKTYVLDISTLLLGDN